ncbi:KTSC domain-containing protein [Carnobacterium divergens]|nr:KTSC domain-containing protein [Carnobacterium divergens]TFJ55017.1 KTSC domain-containing protein [Carnobacterium divergens]
MNMLPVSSTNLVAVGYDSSAQELTIEFNSGVYTYTGVPQFIYEELMSAPSMGSYHHQKIKKYPFRRGY